jgi:uncharacterized protein YkvS
MTNLVTKATELIYQMNTDQINQVVEAIKLKRTHLAKTMARSVKVGDIVSFEGRQGPLQGKVLKVNQKTLVVDVGGGCRWKVTASLVTPLAIGA